MCRWDIRNILFSCPDFHQLRCTYSLMIDRGVLLLADFAVGFRDRAEMVGCGPSGQMAVVGRVLALSDVEFFA